ncbi:interleukin-2 receptor subunit beta [Hoplias malabaricus]|uniref:interleukin-2 receptor subunit beta n=1 Tax=Hoplias malabaricus TaxID=27720 RepID=UPI0034629BB7
MAAVMQRVCLISLLVLSGATHAISAGLSCVYDTANISCEWYEAKLHTGQVCRLQATRDTYKGIQNKKCVLEPLQNQGTRGCLVSFEVWPFSTVEKLKLEVICNSTVVYHSDQFVPGQHIKLRPLDRPSVNRGNISWNRVIKANMEFEYQLQFKTLSDSWENVATVKTENNFVVKNRDDLTVQGQYEARVRVKPVEPIGSFEFTGHWSEWSPSVKWTSDVGKNKSLVQDTESIKEKTHLLGPVIGGLSVIILLIFIFSCIFYSDSRCSLSKAGCEHVPDPSKYFQPLLSVHGGNFQKWVGPEHPTHSTFSPQSCDCDISPVEVSDIMDNPLISEMTHLQSKPMSSQQSSGDDQSSSGFSNMGYFYSETQPGSLSVETCSVYFSYQPEGDSGGTLQSTSSYERLKDQGQERGHPMSPDSGFGIEGEEREEDEEESDKEEKEQEEMVEECTGVNVQHLVSFVLSLPASTRINNSTATTHVPLSFAQLPELLPWSEDAEVSGVGTTTDSPESTVVRPSSMVVQPCSSGYLTLKEMQKYSNKSI